MLNMTRVDSSMPLGGKDHQNFSPASPFGAFKGMKSYSSVNMFSNPTRPTDASSEENLLDKNRVVMKVPAMVKHSDVEFIHPAGSLVFAWGSEDTINRSTHEPYEVLQLSALNAKIRERQFAGYVELESLASGRRKSSSSSFSLSRELDKNKNAPIDVKMKSYFMNLCTLSSMITPLGLPISDVTQGTAASLSIMKKHGSINFTVMHEGRCDIGNAWEDLSSGCKANFILTKRDPINIDDPFHKRPFQMLPLSSATPMGDGAYFFHGVKPTSEFSSSSGLKRTRITTDRILTKKRVKGEIRDTFDEADFLTTHTYHRFSMILNPDMYEESSVTGTIGSVLNHEKKVMKGKENDLIPSNIIPTFLDWSWMQFGDVYVQDPKSQGRTNSIYGKTFWTIKRQDALVYPVGLVTTSLRGRVASQDVIKKYVFSDHEEGARYARELVSKSKLTMHVRLQV